MNAPRRLGRLREGITLHKSVEWCMFIVMSLQTVNFPFAANEFSLRELLKDFVAPSLILTEDPLTTQSPASDSPDAGTAVEPLVRGTG